MASRSHFPQRRLFAQIGGFGHTIEQLWRQKQAPLSHVNWWSRRRTATWIRETLLILSCSHRTANWKAKIKTDTSSVWTGLIINDSSDLRDYYDAPVAFGWDTKGRSIELIWLVLLIINLDNQSIDSTVSQLISWNADILCYHDDSKLLFARHDKKCNFSNIFMFLTVCGTKDIQWHRHLCSRNQNWVENIGKVHFFFSDSQCKLQRGS